MFSCLFKHISDIKNLIDAVSQVVGIAVSTSEKIICRKVHFMFGNVRNEGQNLVFGPTITVKVQNSLVCAEIRTCEDESRNLFTVPVLKLNIVSDDGYVVYNSFFWAI